MISPGSFSLGMGRSSSVTCLGPLKISAFIDIVRVAWLQGDERAEISLKVYVLRWETIDRSQGPGARIESDMTDDAPIVCPRQCVMRGPVGAEKGNTSRGSKQAQNSSNVVKTK